MLGPTFDPQSKPMATDAALDEARAAADLELDVIERAAANRPQPVESPAGRRNFQAAPAVEVSPAPPPRITTRSLHIDLDRLRKMNMITPDAGRSPIGESFRRVKRHVLANMANAEDGVPGNLIMVTSPFSHEGKTFCAVNFAISMAMEMDRTVLLVDADVAKPSIPGVLGFKSDTGLMDVLYDRSIDLADVLCKTNIEKLTILPAGKGRHHATEMLGSEMMRALLQEMAERYSDRIIIFDSPPLLAASEASVLGGHMGQIVMVVEAGKTTETALKDALSRIENCRNVGLLLNKVDGPRMGYGSYSYGYGYGYGE
jgi:receptor protein-tyrosine kinase